jgi:hypothetical protein
MIAYVRELLEVTGTRRKVQGEITKLQEVATRIITDLPVEEQYKVLLHNLAVYNVNRTK